MGLGIGRGGGKVGVNGMRAITQSSTGRSDGKIVERFGWVCCDSVHERDGLARGGCDSVARDQDAHQI